MKTFLYAFILVGFCWSSRAQSLNGTSWTMDYNATLSSMTTSATALLNAQDPAIKQSILDDIGTYELSFHSDGTYDFWVNDRETSGTWSLSGTSLTITLDSHSQQLEVVSNDGTTLVLKRHEESDSAVLFHYWHLTSI